MNMEECACLVAGLRRVLNAEREEADASQKNHCER